MTGEPMNTASKERMAPELMFSPERAPQLLNKGVVTSIPPIDALVTRIK